MREIPLSNCEREFLLDSLSQKRRLDGREAYDFRAIKVSFGIDRGCCTVQLGDTRVMVQVSSEVTEPKQTRPTEGIVFVNVELSPMAAPHFETGRQSEYGVEITRLLERCIKESRCVDTESLCIMAGIKVWSIRVDIHILNDDGNLVDSASIAAIAALAHFRRPDVTVTGEDVTIHSTEDRDPVPLSIHHMPICVTFAFFHQGKYLLVDPTDKEEKVMEGKMVIGMNKHREICTFQVTGSMLLLRDQVLRCSNIAVVKVTEITELIQKALENDANARSQGEKFGFAASVETMKVTCSLTEGQEVDMKQVEEETTQQILDKAGDIDLDSDSDVSEKMENKVNILAPGTGEIGAGGPSAWGEEEEEEMLQELQEEANTITKNKHKDKNNQHEKLHSNSGDLGDESEEDETVTLEKEEISQVKPRKKSQQSTAGNIDLSKALRKESKGRGKKSKKK